MTSNPGSHRSKQRHCATPSVIDLLARATRRHPERVAFRFGDGVWTYTHLDRVTDSLAAGLQARGVGRGDRVAFLLPNGPELVFLNLACLKIRAIAVPLNVRLKSAELEYILAHCRARLCVAHADLYANLAPARDGLAYLQSVFIAGSTAIPSGCEPFASLLESPGRACDVSAADADDVVAILYTSGTTARPKGVTHTHATLASTVLGYVEAVRLHAEDVVFGMLSMSHVFGYTLQLLSPLAVGATVVAAPSFDAPRTLEAVRRHRVTHLYGLPVMFDTLTREATEDTTAFASLRYCLAGGDAVSRRLSDRVREVLGVELHEGCGMTEVIPYALNRPGIENRAGSIGRPSIGMALRLVNEDGEDVAEDEAGEILVRSRALTTGYWEDPAATASAFTAGWFHTGDLGRRDRDGYYWFVGRRKEIIVRGGSNISPLEVEAVLSQHPAVREVGVVGVPHPSLGESVAAFVVLKGGAVSSEQDLRQFASARIAEYKVPERMTFLPDLPRGLTGKVQRRTLREWGAAADQR